MMNPFTPAEVELEISEKFARLQKWMRENHYSGLCLTSARNFSWTTGGLADNQIAHSKEVGDATIVITQYGHKFVVAPHSEVPRLMDQTLERLGYEPIETKWYAHPCDLSAQLNIPEPLASDIQRQDCATGDVAGLRREPSETEIRKYACAGPQCAEAVAEVARQVRPGMSERKIEAMIAHALFQRGLCPTVLRIGSDERVYRFRHCLTSDKLVRKYAMVNVCAKK
jgi:Xaa-Pro aminopeptidase